MTQDTSGYPPGGGSAVPSSDSPSTTQVARDEAKGVAGQATQAGGQVASTAADQAKQVTAETRRQAGDLVQQGLAQVRSQAQDSQLRAAVGVSGLADQLRGMTQGSDQVPGVAQDLVHQVADRIQDVADWLERREPKDLLDDVRSFARQRPGAFLGGSAVLGLVVGRLTRGVVASQSDTIDTPRSSYDSSRHSAVGTFGGAPALETPPMGTDYTSAGTAGYGTAASGYPTGTTGYETAGTGYSAGTTGYETGTASYETGTTGYETGTTGYGDQDTSWQTDPGYAQPASGYGQHEATEYGRSTEIDPITGEPRAAVEEYGTGGTTYPPSGQVRP